MLSRTSVLLTAILSALIPIGALAAPKEGDKELQISGSWFNPLGKGNQLLGFDGSLGYYMTPGWEAGLRQSFVYNERPGPDVWYATTAPFLDYNFNNCFGDDMALVPFIGGFVGMVWNDDDITGTTGPEAGVKWYVADNVSLQLRYRYDWFWDKLEQSNISTDSDHSIGLGLGWNW